MRFCSSRAILWLVGLAACSGGGCSGSSSGRGDGGATTPAPLRIAAASDLDRALPRLARRFQEQTQATTTLTLDASGRLAEQIKAGAPFDLFMAANVKFVADLAKSGLVDPRSVESYARGTLVLCLHKSVPDQVRSLSDLVSPKIGKVAIANPDYAPYGVAARQALERVGLWTTLEGKIVRADSVRQAQSYAQSGDADAALVSRAQVNSAEVRIVEIDPALYEPIVQALGIVAATGQRKLADEFAAFVLGPEGQQILRGAGFEQPTLPTATSTDFAKPAAPSQ